MSSHFKRLVCRCFIAALLFAQFAVAVHACEMAWRASGQLQTPAVAAPAAAGMGSMAQETPDDPASAPCEHTAMAGEATSSLCLEHCSYGEQSNQSLNLSLPAPAMISLYDVPPWRDHAPSNRMAATSAFIAASPPHSILHCCFRI